MFARQMFMFEAPEDGGGAPGGTGDYERVMGEQGVPAGAPGEQGGEQGAAGAGGWQPTEEWGQRIDQFISGAAPVLNNLNELLSAPPEDHLAGFQDPYAGQQGLQFTGDPAYDQWLQDYAAWSEQYGGGQDPYNVLGGGQQQGFDPQIITSAVQEALGPYAPMLEQMASQQGEQMATEALKNLEGSVGAFDHNRALTIAQSYLAQGYDAETALTEAAKTAHTWQEEIGQAAVAEYKQTLERQAGATGDMGAGGAAMEMPGVPKGGNRYEEVVARMLSGVQT